MELDEHVFLEELLSLRKPDGNWDTIPTEINQDLCYNPWTTTFDYSFDETNISNFHLNYSSSLDEFYKYPLPSSNEFSVPQIDDSAYAAMEMELLQMTTPLPFQPNIEQEDQGSAKRGGENVEEEMGIELIKNLKTTQTDCKIEPNQSPETPSPSSTVTERKNRAKKMQKTGQGQPSKNLMAERRRRKRLNDRLSMLRSIVPKISKMDRTAILADAIEYMKELVQKIRRLQREVDDSEMGIGVLEDGKVQNEFLARNSPKFEVESKKGKTRIEIRCGGKPGLVLSTVSTIEALGLEIQQCVISCFNDFALQASCSQELKHNTELEPGELKEALFRNAGYGGSCL